MGFDCEVEEVFTFIYKSDVGQGLVENEFDHVFIGTYNDKPKINPEEVNDWKFMSVDKISEDMEQFPERYTVWFRIAFNEILKRKITF